MFLAEDIRNRRFSWSYRGGFPIDVLLIEDSSEVGWLRDVSIGDSDVAAQFAGLEWRIAESQNLGPYRAGVSVLDGPAVCEAHKRLFGSIVVKFIEGRSYSLKRNSLHVSSWLNDDSQDAIVFHRSDVHTNVAKLGEVIVGKTVAEPDAPALVVLGVLFAVQERMFEHYARGV